MVWRRDEDGVVAVSGLLAIVPFGNAATVDPLLAQGDGMCQPSANMQLFGGGDVLVRDGDATVRLGCGRHERLEVGGAHTTRGQMLVHGSEGQPAALVVAADERLGVKWGDVPALHRHEIVLHVAGRHCDGGCRCFGQRNVSCSHAGAPGVVSLDADKKTEKRMDLVGKVN